MTSKSERRFGTIIPAYTYIRLGKTVAKDSRVKIIGGMFNVGSQGTVVRFQGLGRVKVKLDNGDVRSFESRLLEVM